MVTIKEVAKLANLSTGTVSRVLNNSGYVSQESRMKIEKAMKKLDYHPNVMARALNHKKSKIIGLMIPDITNPFFPELMRGVEETALEYGYTVMLCNTGENSNEEKKYLEFFKRYYVEGIISASSPAVKEWKSLNVPVILTDRIVNNTYPYVAVDNYKAAKELTEFLIQRGARSIVHIAGSKGISTSTDRVLGYKKAMETADLKESIYYTDFNSVGIREKAEQFFKEEQLPDAIFCANDLIAAIFLHYATKHNINVPEELQIVGFDGIFLSELLNPPLTTMEQPIYEMGKVACNTLLEKLEQDIVPTNKKLTATLKVRGTTL